MAELHEKHTIFGPFPDWDPIDTALLFLRTSRYQLETEERGTAPAELVVERVHSEEPAAAEVSTPTGADSVELEGGEADAGGAVSAEAPGEPPEGEVENEAAGAPVEAAPAALGPPEEVLLRAVVKRGKSGSGYFTSNMAELPTTLTLVLDKNTVRIEYAVDTSGQFLKDDEREFWRKEARALEAFVKGAGMVDVIDEERARARAARGDLLTMGLWAAGIVFFLVFVGGVILFRG